MGCCTSTAHTHRPSKPLTYPPLKYAENSQTEEIKDPDRYRKPSIDPTMMRVDSLPPSGLKKPAVQENSAQKSKQESVLKCDDISLVLSNKKEKEQLSASKVVVEEMNKSEPVTAKMKESSSTYKITREQHELILKFVEEKRDVIESDISRLYTHLLINHKEAEELPMLIETLKNNNRDVENCVDDLKMHPIVNDRAFYRVIERHDNLIKNVLSEYRVLAKKGLNGYKNFRDAALDHIRQYNSSQQDTGVSENTSEPHTNEENGNLSDVYNRIVEDLGKVKEMKQNFGSAKEILRTKYNDLGERVTDFQKKLHQQNGLSISEKIDYNSKLKVLNEQIQQGKQEIEDLDGGAQTQPQYMGLSDILSGTTSLFQSANMQSQSKARGCLNGLKKYDNPNLFMERKLSANGRPEIKQGDNGDNDLDMIDIELK